MMVSSQGASFFVPAKLPVQNAKNASKSPSPSLAGQHGRCTNPACPGPARGSTTHAHPPCPAEGRYRRSLIFSPFPPAWDDTRYSRAKPAGGAAILSPPFGCPAGLRVVSRDTSFSDTSSFFLYWQNAFPVQCLQQGILPIIMDALNILNSVSSYG